MVQPDREGREEEDPDEGTIVDPRIIAERRARRAELAEDALHDRAIAAERQLAHAHRQLEFAHDQRKDLAARLKQAERDLRGAQQGEYAEAQRREEIEEDATAARREDERELSALRKALERAQAQEQELEDELARVRRAAQRTQQDSRTALAAAVQDSANDDRAALNEAEAVRALEVERERAAAEVTLLQHELDRRVRIQEAVTRQLVELRAQLESTQSSLTTDTERSKVSDLVLTELGSTALALRDELRGLEEQRAEIEAQLAAAEVAVTAAERRAREAADELEAERRQRAQVESDLHMTIAEERDAFRVAVEEHRAKTQAAIARECATFETQMTALQENVTALRERLQEAEAEIGVRVQDERDVRRVAEAERDRLAEELRSRESLEADFQRSLALLTDELAEVRSERAGRAQREAQMEGLVNELVGTAGSLKEGFEQEIATMTAEREARRQAEEELRRAREAAVTTDHPARSEDASGDESAGGDGSGGEAERLRAALTAQQQAAAQAETRIVELEDELEQARVALRPLPPADHPALQEPAGPQAGGEGDADSVIIDLARAAARLRTPPVDLGRADDEGTLRTDAEPEATAHEATADDRDVDDHPAGTPEEPDDPSSRPTLPEVQIGRRADSAAPWAPSPWLTTAIAALALRDAAAAAGLIQILLPVQGTRLRQDLAYDLAIAGHPELRVQLGADGSTAVMQRAAAGAATGADARIAGSAESLAALVAGGTKRRLPAGVSVTGKRRRARRLARAMRPAVGLSAVSAAGIELPVRLTLQLLADVILVPVGDDQRFTVAFAEEAGPVQAHVVACDDAPLQVHAGAPAQAAATVRVPAGRLGAFLAGDGGARVQGDVAVVGRLLTWADAAQGLDIRRRP